MGNKKNDGVRKIYKQGEPKFASPFLAKKVHAQASASRIGVCADVVIIDQKRKTFWLPTRRVLPHKNLWVIGGRRNPGESAQETVRRHFQKDTRLDLQEKRFSCAATIETIWDEREEKPQDIGRHDITDIFTVTLTQEERTRVSLNPHEYNVSLGLQEFNYEGLTKVNAHQALLDLHKKLFG